MRFYSSFFTFILHHSIKDKAEVQTFKNFLKWSVKFSYIIGFSRLPRYRRKRTVSLHVFGENAMFHSTYSPKSRNSAPSLNMLYTAKSEQFNSPFSPKTLKTIRKRTVTKTTLNFTLRFCRHRSAMLRAFGEIGEW